LAIGLFALLILISDQVERRELGETSYIEGNMASARPVVWATADEEFVRRIMELDQKDAIPSDVCARYEKVQATFHRAIHSGSIEPLVLLIMVVGIDGLPGKKVIESKLKNVPVGTWVVVRRGSTIVRGTFQGLKAPPLDSLAVVWAEDSSEMEMVFPDHMLEIVSEQKRPDVVPLSEAPIVAEFDPLEAVELDAPFNAAADSGSGAVASEPVALSTPVGFGWKDVAPETPVSVMLDGGSPVDGKFVRQTDDGRLSIRLASGGRARLFAESDVKLVSAAPLGDILQFMPPKG
jgi:hypothetical protein